MNSAEAAYGRAHADLVLLFAGAPNPHSLASEVLATLQRQGWKWIRREEPPKKGPVGDPTRHPEYLAAKEQLRELNRQRAQEEPA